MGGIASGLNSVFITIIVAGGARYAQGADDVMNNVSYFAREEFDS